MNMIWLIRMSKWARKPPSPAKVKLVLGIVAVCFVIWGAELMWGWPEALTVNGKVRP